MKYAIVVVDMLNDFVTGKLTCERALRTIKPNQKLITFARKRNIPIIYANDAHIKGLDKELEL
jgi:nicotinamidase-related amidase